MLWDYFVQARDTQVFCGDLLKLPHDMAESVFRENTAKIDDDTLTDITANLLHDSLFLENKNDSAFMLSCIILSVFSRSDTPKEKLYQLFRKSLSLSEKKNGFSDKCVKIFSKLILSDNNTKNFFFKIDLLEWERHDRYRVYNFVKFLEEKNCISLTSSEMKKWIEENEFESPDRVVVMEKNLNGLKKISKNEKQLQIIETLQQNINEIKQEIDIVNKKLNDNYRIISEKEADNTRLRNSLTKREKECFSLQRETQGQKMQISIQKQEISDLKNELAKFAHMADATRDNEIFTLKNDIKLALKGEYDRYIEARGYSCSEDLFEVFKSRFFKIFTTLKRFGISFDGDK